MLLKIHQTSLIIDRDVALNMKSLLDLAQRVSSSNTDIVTYISGLQNASRSPDLRYTWVQEPVKFEDALGRVIPVPSEYDVEVRGTPIFKFGRLNLLSDAPFDYI